MFPHPDAPVRAPGGLLLAIASVLLRDPTRLGAVRAAIADLQHEVLRAGVDRTARWRARLQGYPAVWRTLLAAPLVPTSPRVPILGAPPLASHVASPRGLLTLVGLMLWGALAYAMPVYGTLVIPALLFGSLLAVVLHRWNTRHPSDLPAEDPRQILWTPEITVSRVRIGGDAIGLIVVVGTVAALTAALQLGRWLLLAGVCGLLLAIGLHAWRSRHLTRPTSILDA